MTASKPIRFLVFQRALHHFLAFVGAILLIWLLLAPKEQPAGRVLVLGGQVDLQYHGITLPVENKELARDVRRLANSLRYDDLQDFYPSLGRWPDRVTEFGQSQPVISFQVGSYTLDLFQTQRPQVLLTKTGSQGQIVWKDFYRTQQTELLQSLLELEEQIRQQGPSVLQK